MHTRNGLVPATLIALTIALPALASPPTPRADLAREERVPPEVRGKLLEALQARRQAVTALRGRAQIVISSPQWDGASQAEAAVVARRPDAIRLRAWVGPTSLFDVVGVGDTCGAHLVRYDAYARGPCGGLSALSGVPMEPAHLVEGLFGEPYLDEDQLQIDRVDDDAVYASWPSPHGGRIEGRFRKFDLAPVRYEWRDGGRLRGRITYDDFLKEDAGNWPRIVQIEWPERKALLRLRFYELDLKPELGDDLFAIVPPEGTSVLEWREAIDEMTGTSK